MLEALGLDVSLTANDLLQSCAWYRDVLGFTVDREFVRDGRAFAIRMTAGQAKILLTQDNGAKGAEREKGDGFSMMLTTTQDIDAVAESVKSAGGVLDGEPATAWGARFFRLRDPDGFRWTISSPREG